MSIINKEIKNILNNDYKLTKICKNNFFLMRQLSDATKQNFTDEIVFVDTIMVNDIISENFELVSSKNNIIQDKYSQMFMTKKLYEKKENFFKEQDMNNFTFVDSYDQIFNGFIRTPNFYILINSSVFNERYPVFILINSIEQNIKFKNSNKNYEFYGFILIGYLIDPSPYTEKELINFESVNEISINSIIKKYLLTQPIIKYKNKLFYVDLNDLNESVKIKYNLKSKRNNNIKFIKNIMDAKTIEEKEVAIQENNNFISQMNNGFLYLGVIDNQKINHIIDNQEIELTKQCTALYLLLNYEEQEGIDFSFTLWEHTMINNNVDKMLKLYTDTKINFSLENIIEHEKQLNFNDDSQIIHSMSFVVDC